MTQNQLQLQVTLTLGKQKYLLSVPPHSHLPHLVQRFLQQNSLNTRYHAPILRLVQEKIADQQPQQSPSPSLPVSSPLQEPSSARNGQLKKGLLSRIQEELGKVNKKQDPDSRKVYERWKEKQKSRQLVKHQDHSSVDLGRPSKGKHSPDHFYVKGKQFQAECQQHLEEEFKRLYPFKLRQVEMTEAEKAKLYERLAKEHNVQGLKKEHVWERYQSDGGLYRQKRDEVKQKVGAINEQIDRTLFEMLQNGELRAQKVRKHSKSPFRKTMI